MYREKRGNVPGPYLFFRGAAWAQDGDFIEKGIANALRICYNPKRRKSAAEAGLSEGRRRPAEAADAAESAIAGAAESPREMSGDKSRKESQTNEGETHRVLGRLGVEAAAYEP